MTGPNNTQATQTRHPWRATLRTAFAVLIALTVILPIVADELGIRDVPWVAGVLAVAAGVTRVLAIPAVNDWLRDHVPGLSAEGRDDS